MTKKQKDRWIKCLDEAAIPLQELVDLQSDAQIEYDKMSDKRKESPLGQLLERLANPNPDFSSVVDEIEALAAEIDDQT